MVLFWGALRERKFGQLTECTELKMLTLTRNAVSVVTQSIGGSFRLGSKFRYYFLLARLPAVLARLVAPSPLLTPAPHMVAYEALP